MQGLCTDPSRSEGPTSRERIWASLHMAQHTGTGNQHSPVGSCTQHCEFPSRGAAASEEPPGEAEGLEEPGIPLDPGMNSPVHSCYHGTPAGSDLGRKDKKDNIRTFSSLLLGAQHWRCGIALLGKGSNNQGRSWREQGDSGNTQGEVTHREQTVPLLWDRSLPCGGAGDATCAAVPRSLASTLCSVIDLLVLAAGFDVVKASFCRDWFESVSG